MQCGRFVTTQGIRKFLMLEQEKFGESYLIPSYDPDLVSSLAKTLCGGSSGGACVKGDPTKGGGGSGGGSGGGGTKRSTDSAEFKNLAVLAY
jgi:hypothetical protein